jgi:hypothetical protein
MVIETGVHRWDGSQACREKTSLTDHVAEAGLDEFGPMWLQYLGEVGPMTMRATDLDRTWSYGTGGGDIVEGTASDLYLRLMSRPSPVELPSAWATAVDGLTPPPKPDRSPRPT